MQCQASLPPQKNVFLCVMEQDVHQQKQVLVFVDTVRGSLNKMTDSLAVAKRKFKGSYCSDLHISAVDIAVSAGSGIR